MRYLNARAGQLRRSSELPESGGRTGKKKKRSFRAVFSDTPKYPFTGKTHTHSHTHFLDIDSSVDSTACPLELNLCLPPLPVISLITSSSSNPSAARLVRGQMAMVRASLGGVLGCVLLSLALGSSNVDFGAPPASFYPRFNPFFFLCTHHTEMEGAGVAEGGGEVLLTLQITGNPSTYTPGQEYQGEHTL